MATTTSRLGLTKPATTEDYAVGVFNTNADLVDAAVGVTPATSTTRPSTQLFDGRAVHESDTGELVIRRGTVWSVLGTIAATSDRIARRTTGGRLKVGTATEADDAVTKAQLDAVSGGGVGAWQTPTFQNGWANLNPTAYRSLQYRWTPTGVQIVGVLTWQAPSTICTLPTGYRPPQATPFVALTGNTAAMYVEVNAAGALALTTSGGASFLAINAMVPL